MPCSCWHLLHNPDDYWLTNLIRPSIPRKSGLTLSIYSAKTISPASPRKYQVIKKLSILIYQLIIYEERIRPVSTQPWATIICDDETNPSQSVVLRRYF